MLGACIGGLTYFLLVGYGNVLNLGDSSAKNSPNRGAEGALAAKSVFEESMKDSEPLVSFQELRNGLQELDVNELLPLVEQSAAIENSAAIAELQSLLLGELARLDPVEALNTIWSFPSVQWNDLLVVVFGEWSIVDLDQAVRSAMSLNGPARETAVQAILAKQEDLSNPALLRVTSEEGIDQAVVEQVRAGEAMALIDQPRLAWNLLLHDDVSNKHQTELLIQVAEEWMRQDGVEVVGLLYNELCRRDNEFYLKDWGLFESILASAVEHEPQRVFDFVLTMQVEDQQELAPSLLSLWSQRDPREAFAATAKIESALLRARVESLVTMNWANKDSRDLLNNIAQLPRNSRKSAVSSAIGNLAQDTPMEALEWIRTLQHVTDAVDEETEHLLVQVWSRSDPVSAMEWVRSNTASDSTKRARMIQWALREYALVNPEKALSAALEEVPHRWHGMTGLESLVIDSLAGPRNVDKAIEMLPRVRESAVGASYYAVGYALVQFNRWDDALALAENLTSDKQLEYFTRIVPAWGPFNIKELIDRFPLLPSEEIRSATARSILSNTWMDFELTEDQTAYLKTFEESEPTTASEQ